MARPVKGPISEKRTEACQIPLGKPELREYVRSGDVDVALVLDWESSGNRARVRRGWEMLWLTPAEDVPAPLPPGEAATTPVVKAGRYAVKAHTVLSAWNSPGVGRLVWYEDRGDRDESVTWDEAANLADRAILNDANSSRKVYNTRPCAEYDQNYSLEHSLLDMDRKYAQILSEYEVQKGWFSALRVFMLVTVNGLVLRDLLITRPWYSIHKDLLRVFGEGASDAGDESELDTFIERVGDVQMLVRKRMEEKSSPSQDALVA
jgi:hypothetical protein